MFTSTPKSIIWSTYVAFDHHIESRFRADDALKKGANEAQLVEAYVCAVPFSEIAALF